ncbi:MAG: M24 family metallopeptidase [Patescibacteria group bacterium]
MKTKLIHEVRAVKAKKELANIIKAQRISEQVLHYTIVKLRAGVSEVKIANLIKRELRKRGAPILSFEPIVSFGKNTAKVHHMPGKAKLKRGDIAMLDFGTTVNHYCSDMTRTFFAGVPTKRQKKVYLKVLKAQKMALRKIEQGERRTWIIDKAVRKFLGRKHFPHGLGHGIGTVIHEWPNFKPQSGDILPVGCVMTVEPGLYFKGWGGVRIEDMVLITQKGLKNLTNFPKDIESAILPGWREKN